MTIATIGQGEVAETPCVSLFVVDQVLEVATEQVSEARFVSKFPVSGVPISLAPKRGWYQWCDRAALAGWQSDC